MASRSKPLIEAGQYWIAEERRPIVILEAAPSATGACDRWIVRPAGKPRVIMSSGYIWKFYRLVRTLNEMHLALASQNERSGA